MRVQIRFTVDIDPDAWVGAYGGDRSEIRAEVRSMVEVDTALKFADAGVLAQPIEERRG